MTPKEFKDKCKNNYCTVGDLKKYLEGYPDDSIVVSQRVEDVYYEKYGWETLDIPDTLYPEHNNQYTPVFSPVLREDKNCFYLDLHY